MTFPDEVVSVLRRGLNAYFSKFLATCNGQFHGIKIHRDLENKHIETDEKPGKKNKTIARTLRDSTFGRMAAGVIPYAYEKRKNTRLNQPL